MKVLLFYLVVAVAVVSNAFELTGQSGDATIVEGGSHSLYCESDIPYEFCKWTHVESGTTCSIANDYIEGAYDCKSQPKLLWDLTETKCGITIEGASRPDDVGTYKCELYEGPTVASGNLKIDVEVPSYVSFTGQFSEGSTVEVVADQTVIVECEAMAGFPEPHVLATMVMEGTDEEPTELTEVPEMTTRTEKEDGTVSVKKGFTLYPHANDCGKHVICHAIQGESFHEEMARKLSVTFPPAPLDEQLAPFGFQVDSEYPAVAEIKFMANPTPEDNQAIWHINPSGQEAQPDSVVLQAGVISDDSKYEALPLNISGHEVTATLLIQKPQLEEENYAYHLHVMTKVGDNSYAFRMQRQVVPYYPTTIQPDGRGGQAGGSNGSTSKMGAGSVAAIVIIILLILAGVGVTYWARKNDKWCFRQASTKPVIDEESNVPLNGGGHAKHCTDQADGTQKPVEDKDGNKTQPENNA